MGSGTIPWNKKEYGLQSYIATGTQTVVLDNGCFIVVCKRFGDPTCYGVYIVTNSTGANEHSLVTLQTGSTAPNLSLSGSNLTLTAGTGVSFEFAIINLTMFR